MRADIAIITIREDEYDAVFNRLEEYQFKPLRGSSLRSYATFSVPISGNRVSSVVLARSAEQGNDTSQHLARDMMQDFDPQILLVVGVAGAIPHNEFTLGDVVISSRIHNFDVNAIDQGKKTFDVRGGIHPLVSDITASLPMYKRSLAAWNSADSIGMERPEVDLVRAEANVYGDDEWRKEVLVSLNAQFGVSASRSPLPLFKTGSIASSNSLMKDTQIPALWSETVRSILAIEMESAGVLQAAQQMGKQYPVMAIRGISDIIGFKRDGNWTSYACQSAGAFTLAFIKAGIIEPQNSTLSTNPQTQRTMSNPPPARATNESPKSTALDLFISYAEEDEKFKEDLEKHLVMLKRTGIIRPWHSHQTQAGLEKGKDIDAYLNQSQIILLLISQNFLASDHLYDQEMMRAMDRHEDGTARVVPIMIRSANIDDTPFKKLQALPRSPQPPVDQAKNRDDAWVKIVQEIRDICKSLLNGQDQS